MFFYLLDRIKNNVEMNYNIDAISTVAYLILYSYVPEDLRFYYWALFVIDVLITFYKKTIFDKIDEWYGDEKKEQKEDKQKKQTKKIKNILDNDLKTTKSGYFESALDELSFTKSSDLMIEKMIKDSKSF